MKKIILSSFLFATLNAASIPNDTIHIKFEGNTYYSTANMLKILDIKSNEVNKKNFVGDYVNKLLKKIRAENSYKDVKAFYNKKRSILTFKLVEKRVITSVKIKNFKENKTEQEISSYLGLDLGSFYDKKAIKKAKEIITTALKKEGYTDTKIEVTNTKIKNNNIELIFDVSKGYKNVINKINLEGVKSVDKKDILSVMKNKEKTPYLSWLFGFNDGIYNENEFNDDKNRIIQKYYTYGYLDAKVISTNKRIIENENISLDLKINEGQQYILKYIEANTNIYNKEVNKIVTKNLIIGKPINIENLVKTINKLKIFFKNKGYYDVEVSPKIEKGNKKVYIAINIEENKKYTIGDVIINGNYKTLDSVIRRNISIATSDLYQYNKIENSKKALMRTGYFKNVSIKETKIGKSKIQLEFIVTEQNTGILSIGGGYGEYQGIFAKLTVKEKNIFGSGIGLLSDISKSSKDTNINLGITNNRIDNSNYSGSYNVYYKDFKYPDYTINSLGTSIGLGKNINPFLNIYTNYTVMNSKYKDIFNTFQNYFPSYMKSALSFGFSYDDTDEYYLASEGMRANYNVEIAGIGGEAEFIKEDLNFNFYNNVSDLFNHDTILRFKNKLGYIYDYGFLPLNDKYYMGGQNSVRGYENYSISPKINSNSKSLGIGGKFTFLNTVELSTALQNRDIRLFAFTDIGVLANNFDDNIIKGGTGLGLEWLSPIGSFKLSLAKPLMYDKGKDKSSFFTFGFGTKF